MTKLREDLTAPQVLVPTMLTAHDIAELCRVSDDTVLRWARNGTGGFPKPLVRDGGKLRLFLASEYVEWIEAKAVQRDGAPAPRFRRR